MSSRNQASDRSGCDHKVRIFAGMTAVSGFGPKIGGPIPNRIGHWQDVGLNAKHGKTRQLGGGSASLETSQDRIA